MAAPRAGNFRRTVRPAQAFLAHRLPDARLNVLGSLVRAAEQFFAAVEDGKQGAPLKRHAHGK
jgi:hypothetical protein